MTGHTAAEFELARKYAERVKLDLGAAAGLPWVRLVIRLVEAAYLAGMRRA